MMTDQDYNEGFTEDTQEYIEGRLETGSEKSLDPHNQRVEELEREIIDLERRVRGQDAAADASRRLREARTELDELRERGRM